MKKMAIGLVVIIFQLLIASLFFMTIMNDKIIIHKYETHVNNENLNKISTSVSLLFKEEMKKEGIVDSVIQELPSVETIQEMVNNQEEVKVVDERSPLVSIDASKYINNEEMGFIVTENNRNFDMSEDEFNVVVAVIAGEFDKNENDALAVVSVILNRCDSDKWSSWAGNSPYNQVTKKGQFEVYGGGYYLDFMPGGVKYGSSKYNIAKQALIDGMNGIRNNNYLGFRAWWISSYSDKYIVTGGNRYGYN